MADKNTIKNKIEAPKRSSLEEALKKIDVAEAEKEKGFEQSFEKKMALKPGLSEEGARIREKLSESTSALATVGSLNKKREERKKKIEQTMSEDLEDIYLKMPPNLQKEFKEKGEKTAEEINSLLDKARVKVKKIVNLLKKWLAIIPGVNSFFLEQEAKIKADKIIKIKEEKDF